jgi:hypothetical protein
MTTRRSFIRLRARVGARGWRQFLGDCNNFLASSENWAERAAALGWDAPALFGYCRHRNDCQENARLGGRKVV